MSSSLKYLKKAQGDTSQESAAQDFLQEKLDNNRFTVDQQATLDANGGPTVANATGDDFENQDFADKAEAASGDVGGGGEGTLRERYEAKFGSNVDNDLGAANDASSANAIYDKIKSLESDDYWADQNLSDLMGKAGHQETIVNIGNYTKDGGLAVDASIAGGINFENIQSQLDENDWNGEKNNSIGQLGSALLAADGTGGKSEGKEELPVEHSPEIQQAKERVRAYEDDVLSGKVSDDIYGSKDDSYSFNASLGAEGIGTPLNGSRREQADLATDSFLDNKKTEVKKKYQFQAKR